VLNNERVEPTAQHVVDRYLQLLQPFGGSQAPQARFELPIRQFTSIDTFIHNTQLTEGFAVLNPGGGWESKRWPERRFAQLARRLGEQHNLPSVITWAGSQERAWAVEIVQRAGGHAWLAPPTTLPELATLTHKARLCVAGDTGPLHLAAAVGTRCVGLHGTTRPERSGAYGPRHEHVQAFYQSGSSRQRRQAPNHAMQAIEVPMVLQACGRLLSQKPTQSPHAA
jgi:ADP-heptose:LPS heptosyltransferase